MMKRIVAATRYFAVVPVVCIAIGATALMIYGAIETFMVVWEAFTAEISNKGSKQLLLSLIELVDLFLLATVLYIIALGLYELFIDSSVPLPSWLTIHNLDDLKNNLIGVVIVVLGVLFLGQVISGSAPAELLTNGLSIAAVIFALTYFLALKTKK
jgi:uncharacterized membrane protein YqhA